MPTLDTGKPLYDSANATKFGPSETLQNLMDEKESQLIYQPQRISVFASSFVSCLIDKLIKQPTMDYLITPPL